MTVRVRYDIAPLLEFVCSGRPMHRNAGCVCNGSRIAAGLAAQPTTAYPCVSIGDVAAELGVTHRTVQRWFTSGDDLSIDMADRYAIAAGIHPFLLWPDMVDDIVGDDSGCERCADDDCRALFVPYVKHQRFCTPRCESRVADRRCRLGVEQLDRPIRVCAASDCDVTFKPRERRQRFHSRQCRKRTANRERVDYMRAYRETHRSEHVDYMRAYHDAERRRRRGGA